MSRLLLVLAIVVLIRIPFLTQPVQGDDVYYLAMARNTLADPLHPMQMGYTFQGQRVSMAGHPHPPLNSYALALLLRVFGEVRERAFHLAYLAFSLIAAAAMYSLARRFSERPLLATLLFVSAPAFVVNGNSFEADLPLLAFWMAGFALYFAGRHLLGAAALALAALAAYQAVFAAPILAYHAWHQRRRSRTAWLAAAAAPLTLAAWQLFQRLTVGETPAGVLAGYLEDYGLLAAERKLASAVTLVGHLGWLVFPLAGLVIRPRLWLSGGAGALIAVLLPGYYPWWQRALLALSLTAGLERLIGWALEARGNRRGDSGFLAAWGLVFFGASAAVFFAGSARYLLPLAAPAALLITRSAARPWLLWIAAGLNLALGLTLASANYQYAVAYRDFAALLQPRLGERRLWFSAEWGLRHYLERLGGEPLVRDQPAHSGAVVVSSELAGRTPFFAGGPAREILRAELWSRPPVRLIGLGTRSGYSSSALGALPFDPGGGLLDRLRVEVVGLAEPRLSFLRMNDPQAAGQLLAGFFQVEDNAWRWMSEQGSVLLKAPGRASRFEMTFLIPEAAPARQVTVAAGESVLIRQTYPAPGHYTLSAGAPFQPGASVQIVVSVDKTFQPARDPRKLGIVVRELGLR